MMSESLSRALARVERQLLGGSGPESVLVRRELGRQDPGDADLADVIVRGLAEVQDAEGSWKGGVVPTAETLLLLHELGGDHETLAPAVAKGLAWLRSRRGMPGRFGDGCDPDRHRLGFCHHFLGGFYSPAPGDGGVRTIAQAPDARAAALAKHQIGTSCIALRAFLVWGDVGTDVQLHIDGLLRLAPAASREPGSPVPIDALPAILHALLHAPANPAVEEVVDTTLTLLLQMQRADGSWPELDAFEILEILLTAMEKGRGGPGVDAAIRRAAGLLAATQQTTGLWERDSATHRTRIGWRALRFATRTDGG